jgi:hypothetical protein
MAFFFIGMKHVPGPRWKIRAIARAVLFLAPVEKAGFLNPFGQLRDEELPEDNACTRRNPP